MEDPRTDSDGLHEDHLLQARADRNWSLSQTGSHHHDHVDVTETSGPRLLLTLALNFIIPVAQVTGGIVSNSMALISDAIHNFSDFTAVLISYVAFILKNCWDIIKEATAVLMNATPEGIDIQKIKDFLENIPGVRAVHYLHAWNMSSSSVAFSCHVEVDDQTVSQTEVLSEKIRHELYHRFGIDHPILQFETVQCGNGGLLCEIDKPGHGNA